MKPRSWRMDPFVVFYLQECITYLFEKMKLNRDDLTHEQLEVIVTLLEKDLIPCFGSALPDISEEAQAHGFVRLRSVQLAVEEALARLRELRVMEPIETAFQAVLDKNRDVHDLVETREITWYQTWSVRFYYSWLGQHPRWMLAGALLLLTLNAAIWAWMLTHVRT